MSSFDDMPKGGEREWQAEGYLVAIAYDEEPKAAEMLSTLRELQDSGALELTDAVGIACDSEGKVRIVETVGGKKGGHPVAKGALWGVVVGALFTVPVVGLAAGAGVEAIRARGDRHGITREFQKRVADRLQPNTSAVLVLGRATSAEKRAEVLQAVAPLGGHLIHTDLSPDVLDELEKALTPDESAGADSVEGS
ncbi:MAG TPA: DUF1269 domain-containing protein [Actinomycetota bacterium]|nr:DUF1269 domain-containing protein [Actinomycetota bacterium]